MFMKKILYILLFLGILISCDTGSGSKDDDDDSLVTESEADPADDGKATGVYKGVIADTDTSGTYKIVIESSASGRAAGDVYKATLYLDVEGVTIVKEGSATELADGSLDLTFSLSVIGASFVFDLNISSTGTITDLEVTMDGQVISTVAEKETSTVLLEAWEGTYTGSKSFNDGTYTAAVTSTGTWNFLLKGTQMTQGVYHGQTKNVVTLNSNGTVVQTDTDSDSDYFRGPFTDSQIQVSFYNYDEFGVEEAITYLTASGTKAGNSASGTWTRTMDLDGDDVNESSMPGTWKGMRTR